MLIEIPHQAQTLLDTGRFQEALPIIIATKLRALAETSYCGYTRD
jgi:hypothetical protein